MFAVLLHVPPAVAAASPRVYRLDKEGAAGMLGIELAGDDQTNFDESGDDLRCPLHRASRP